MQFVLVTAPTTRRGARRIADAQNPPLRPAIYVAGADGVFPGRVRVEIADVARRGGFIRTVSHSGVVVIVVVIVVVVVVVIAAVVVVPVGIAVIIAAAA